MYGNMDFVTPLLIVGGAIGAAIVGAVWAFVVYVWPWLKTIIHAITA